VVDHDHLEIPSGIPVWQAGPEDPTLGIVLHNQQQHRYEQEISPGVCLSASQETLSHLIGNFLQQSLASSRQSLGRAGVLYPFRLLIGYIGWAAGQLEDELQRGIWLPAALDQEILFNMDYQQMWLAVLERTNFKSIGTRVPHQGQWLH
jgi:putative transcriptional regulator